MNYLDVQISLDGMDAATNDAVRGDGSWAAARRAMDHLAAADFGEFKISIVCTRHNVDQLDAYKAMADDYGAQLRITRLRPSGRGVDSYQDLRLTNAQQRQVFRWILDHPDVLTGDSFFHLNALGTETGESLPGLNLCGAGRIVCLIDPIGDVYACPFVIHDDFLAGNVRDDRAASPGCGVTRRCSPSCVSRRARAPAPRAGASTPARAAAWPPSSSPGCRSTAPTPTASTATPTTPSPRSRAAVPRPSQDHSRPGAPVPVALTRKR